MGCRGRRKHSIFIQGMNAPRTSLNERFKTMKYNIGHDVVITKQHHNTPLGKREEPVGDVVSRRINESGRKLRYLCRSGCHSYTNIKPGNTIRRRKLGSLMDGDL